jgi:hypothetical protein
MGSCNVVCSPISTEVGEMSVDRLFGRDGQQRERLRLLRLYMYHRRNDRAATVVSRRYPGISVGNWGIEMIGSMAGLGHVSNEHCQ